MPSAPVTSAGEAERTLAVAEASDGYCLGSLFLVDWMLLAGCGTCARDAVSCF